VASPSLIAVPYPFLSTFKIFELSLIHSPFLESSFFFCKSFPKKLIFPPTEITILLSKVVCCTTFNLNTSYIFLFSGWNKIILESDTLYFVLLILV